MPLWYLLFDGSELTRVPPPRQSSTVEPLPSPIDRNSYPWWYQNQTNFEFTCCRGQFNLDIELPGLWLPSYLPSQEIGYPYRSGKTQTLESIFLSWICFYCLPNPSETASALHKPFSRGWTWHSCDWFWCGCSWENEGSQTWKWTWLYCGELSIFFSIRRRLIMFIFYFLPLLKGPRSLHLFIFCPLSPPLERYLPHHTDPSWYRGNCSSLVVFLFRRNFCFCSGLLLILKFHR